MRTKGRHAEGHCDVTAFVAVGHSDGSGRSALARGGLALFAFVLDGFSRMIVGSQLPTLEHVGFAFDGGREE